MIKIILKRNINAPLDIVFKGIFTNVIPHLFTVQPISDIKPGIDMKFYTTHPKKNKRVLAKLKVIEFVENEHVHIVCHDLGMNNDITFSILSKNGATEVTYVQTVTAYSFWGKITIAFFTLSKGTVVKDITKQIDKLISISSEQIYKKGIHKNDIRPTIEKKIHHDEKRRGEQKCSRSRHRKYLYCSKCGHKNWVRLGIEAIFGITFICFGLGIFLRADEIIGKFIGILIGYLFGFGIGPYTGAFGAIKIAFSSKRRLIKR